MIKAVSKEYNIQPYFVWQPVPFYNSNENHNKYSETWFSYAKEGYNLMNKKRLNKDLGDNFIWLSNSNSNGDKYVDRVHYSPVFSAKIAKSISSFISPYISKVASQK
jgi:lysophospholipase L1-like esterase